MDTHMQTVRHLLDLCRRSERTCSWVCSGFLTPAEQEDFLQCPEAAGFSFSFDGGFEAAERKLLVAGNEEDIGWPPDSPIRVIAVRPLSMRFAEELTHRDFLGAVLGLGLERGCIGDILVREKSAWILCLASSADFIASSLTEVRRTAVSASIVTGEIPELQPVFAPLRLNVASERLDTVTAAFAGLSRGRAADLFSAEKVQVNGRVITDKSFRMKPGDILSLRGFGKAVYDGIEQETRKNRLWVLLRKYV